MVSMFAIGYMLQNDAQEINAKMLCFSIAVGDVCPFLPISSSFATAIPRATEGFRIIGSIPAYYRLLARTFSPQFRGWEARRPNRHFSCAAGRSAVLTVLAQTAHQELTSAIGRPSSATVLWDLSDFYEGMSRPKL